VLSWFFIEPSTLNHFTPFWRFEKFGYSHLSAASFQPNGIAEFERHVPFPPVAAHFVNRLMDVTDYYVVAVRDVA
jgi:hypothetical protein